MTGAAAEAAAHILSRAEWTYSRASGPGGQHRDHAETRAELTVREEHLAGLADPVRQRLRDALMLDVRPLRLRAGTERSRERNRGIVEARLTARVAAALAPAPPPRRPTRPGVAARERRVEDKTRRAQVKRTRRSVPPDAD